MRTIVLLWSLAYATAYGGPKCKAEQVVIFSFDGTGLMPEGEIAPNAGVRTGHMLAGTTLSLYAAEDIKNCEGGRVLCEPRSHVSPLFVYRFPEERSPHGSAMSDPFELPCPGLKYRATTSHLRPREYEICKAMEDACPMWWMVKLSDVPKARSILGDAVAALGRGEDVGEYLQRAADISVENCGFPFASRQAFEVGGKNDGMRTDLPYVRNRKLGDKSC